MGARLTGENWLISLSGHEDTFLVHEAIQNSRKQVAPTRNYIL